MMELFEGARDLYDH
jgi:serine/threonine protein kinase